MHKQININFTPKQAISWIIGLPAAIVIFSEVNDLALWWLPFVAIAVLAVILFWNGAFSEETI